MLHTRRCNPTTLAGRASYTAGARSRTPEAGSQRGPEVAAPLVLMGHPLPGPTSGARRCAPAANWVRPADVRVSKDFRAGVGHIECDRSYTRVAHY